MTSILGISAFYHDSAATIIIDGKIIAAAQEERFTRIKHDSSYPHNAVEFVLKFSNLKLNNVDHIVFYEKPFLKFESNANLVKRKTLPKEYVIQFIKRTR